MTDGLPDVEEPGKSPRAASSGRGGREYVISSVLQAARELIAERGPSSVSLREIATAAGVNNGLLYQYVGTKDQLVTEVYRRTVAETERRLAETTTLDEALDALLDSTDEADMRLLAWAALDSGRTFQPVQGPHSLQAMITAARGTPLPDGAAAPTEDRVAAALIAMIATAARVFGGTARASAGLAPGDDDPFDAAVRRLVHAIAHHEAG